MKTLITAVAVTLTTLTSFAQEITRAPEQESFVSTRSRAEVRAELMAAIASGTRLSQGEVTRALEQENFVSTRTRAEVRGELLAAIARGERLSYGEASTDQVAYRRVNANPAVTMANRAATLVR